MKSLIKFPSHLLRAAKAKAKKRGLTMSGYVSRLVKKDRRDDQ